MSDYKLTFKLKQHTPYIHFQHNHIGATLRASDLKPRIDKYLKSELGLEKQKYQLTVSSNLAGDPKPKTRDDPYFGEHKLCMYNDIELKFNTYFNDDLEKKIKSILPKVFACENFGSFGSKGYGCFTDENQSQTDFEDLLKKKYENSSKKIYYWDTNKTEPEDIFFQIKYFYALIKAGINIPGRNAASSTYYKSLLMQYFLPNIRWEKRGIKKKFRLPSTYNKTGNIDQTDATIPNGEVYKAVKPLLGYSKSQEWQSYGKTIGIEFPNGIDRINSPLFFKVFKENNKARIYFMLKDEDKFPNKIYPNEKFTYKISGTSEDFYTPDNFDYPNFLQYAVAEINGMTSNGAIGGTAKKVDDFITHLTTTKIQTL